MQRHDGCRGAVELWTVRGGGHYVALQPPALDADAGTSCKRTPRADEHAGTLGRGGDRRWHGRTVRGPSPGWRPGKSVIVLEANDRIGGRILTATSTETSRAIELRCRIRAWQA